MPYHRPIPDSNPRKRGSALVDSMVQAEKMIQIALLLPCAAFIGWLGGAWLDHVFHQTWITTAGVVFGILAGLVGAVRLTIAMAGGQSTPKDGTEGDDKQ
jgi:ATP synthase protein I